MELGYFKKLLKNNNAIKMNDEFILFNDLELYSFFKTKNFKSKEFIKAVKKAKWPANLNYDKGADWWLKKNAKTYGYKYSVS